MKSFLKYLFALPLWLAVSEAGAQGCVLNCPANVVVSSETGKGGAIVQYPKVTGNENCGPVTYTPANGSFFRIGATSVIGTTAAGQKCSFTVTVTDNQAPVLSPLVLSPRKLWPANGKMREVALHYTHSDNAQESTCNVTVASNDQNSGTGTYEVLSPNRVRLLASRLPDGSPRVYTITVTCLDAAGNTARRSTTITVARQAGTTGVRDNEN